MILLVSATFFGQRSQDCAKPLSSEKACAFHGSQDKIVLSFISLASNHCPLLISTYKTKIGGARRWRKRRRLEAQEHYTMHAIPFRPLPILEQHLELSLSPVDVKIKRLMRGDHLERDKVVRGRISIRRQSVN